MEAEKIRTVASEAMRFWILSLVRFLDLSQASSWCSYKRFCSSLEKYLSFKELNKDKDVQQVYVGCLRLIRLVSLSENEKKNTGKRESQVILEAEIRLLRIASNTRS